MMCAWKELLSILPVRLRRDVDSMGKNNMQELRLRIKAPPELVLGDKIIGLSGTVTKEELDFTINTASRYSPWCSSSIAQGYITAPGGHRIGICGEAICKKGVMEGIREVSSLCIRVARDFPGIGKKVEYTSGSILVLGAPGWGKTTLLRDIIRQISEEETVSIVDERGEIFPKGFLQGRHADILTGCPKDTGIGIVLRTMGPSCIAVDEITEEKDCIALMQAADCGVRLLATAHASSIQDYYSRTIYRPLVLNKIFDTIVVLHKDKSYKVERMKT